MSSIRTIAAGQEHADGLCIGDATTAKLAFNGTAPITQPAGAAQAATVLNSVQNATTAAIDLATSEALANALKANYNTLQADVATLTAETNALRTALLNLGLIKGAA